MIKEVSAKKENKLLNNLKYFGVLNLGVLLLSLSMYLFSAPNGFSLGGMGGLSVVLAKYITPEVAWLTQPAILFILNGIMLIIGFIFLGKLMTLKTIYCSTAFSVEVILLDLIHPIEHPLTAADAGSPAELLLELTFAVIFSGAAHAIVFNCRASTGGTDIVALIVKKYSKINIGPAMLVADFFIACLAFFAFGPTIGLISVLGVFAKTFVIDGVIENLAKTKYVTIITVNPDVVADVIIDYIHRGYTKYDAQGGYTGEPRTIIITVCRRTQAARLKVKLHEVDPSAFVIITDANEILGKGFAERM